MSFGTRFRLHFFCAARIHFLRAELLAQTLALDIEVVASDGQICVLLGRCRQVSGLVHGIRLLLQVRVQNRVLVIVALRVGAWNGSRVRPVFLLLIWQRPLLRAKVLHLGLEGVDGLGVCLFRVEKLLNDVCVLVVVIGPEGRPVAGVLARRGLLAEHLEQVTGHLHFLFPLNNFVQIVRLEPGCAALFGPLYILAGLRLAVWGRLTPGLRAEEVREFEVYYGLGSDSLIVLWGHPLPWFHEAAHLFCVWLRVSPSLLSVRARPGVDLGQHFRLAGPLAVARIGLILLGVVSFSGTLLVRKAATLMLPGVFALQIREGNLLELGARGGDLPVPIADDFFYCGEMLLQDINCGLVLLLPRLLLHARLIGGPFFCVLCRTLIISAIRLVCAHKNLGKSLSTTEQREIMLHKLKYVPHNSQPLKLFLLSCIQIYYWRRTSASALLKPVYFALLPRECTQNRGERERSETRLFRWASGLISVQCSTRLNL